MGVGGYLSAKEAAGALGVDAQRVRKLAAHGQLEGVTIGGVLFITASSVMERKERKPGPGNSGLTESKGAEVPDGYVSSGDAARLLNVNPSRISAMVLDGKLRGMKSGGRYVIERDSLMDRMLGRDAGGGGREYPKVEGYMNCTDAARAIGLSRSRLSNAIASGKITPCFREGNKIVLFTVEEVERFKAMDRRPGNPNFSKEP